jgi:hypothetical protein
MTDVMRTPIAPISRNLVGESASVMGDELQVYDAVDLGLGRGGLVAGSFP